MQKYLSVTVGAAAFLFLSVTASSQSVGQKNGNVEERSQYCTEVSLRDGGTNWICGAGFAPNSGNACDRGARQSTPKEFWKR